MWGKISSIFAIVFVASLLVITGSGVSKESKKKDHGFVMIIHKVEDYNNFKKVLKSHAIQDKNAGLKRHAMFKDANDPNNVVIIFKARSLEKAKAYFDDPKTHEMMKDAKIIGKPQIMYMTKAN